MCFVFSIELSIVVWDTGDQRDQQVVRKYLLSPFPRKLTYKIIRPGGSYFYSSLTISLRICRSIKQQENTALFL